MDLIAVRFVPLQEQLSVLVGSTLELGEIAQKAFTGGAGLMGEARDGIIDHCTNL